MNIPMTQPEPSAARGSRQATVLLPSEWRERQQLATSAIESLASLVDFADTIDLLRRLACDDAWEVRHAVAERLLSLPDAEFPWFAERLAADCTRFVRNAARRALSEHERLDRDLQRRKREAEVLARQMQSIEAKLGKEATRTILRTCDSQVEQLVGRMVHDLQGALTYLKASCRAVITDRTPRRKQAQLQDHLVLLETMLQDMASFTRPAPAARRPERLRDVVAAAVDMAKENVCKTGLDASLIAIRLEVCEGIVLPMARHLVLMALVNVIKNAYESFATSAEEAAAGEIVIRSERNRESVLLTISDTGIGMAVDELAEVAAFQPGRRNQAKRHSTGFGLPIAARNLAAHDGTIAIDSRREVGTTVTITLPLKEHDEEPRHAAQGLGRRRRPAYC